MDYSVQLPDNKSIIIRELISNYVFRNQIIPISEDSCNDVVIVHKALQKINEAIRIHNCNLITIDVEDCGAAYRFFMALCAVLPCKVFLTGTPRLLSRPILPLAESLNSVGASINKCQDGWLINGKHLIVNDIFIDAALSSQFISALILAAPLMNLHKINLKSPDISSQSYIEMTLAMMHNYEIDIEGFDNKQHNIGLHGDWSAAVFWFAHACLHPENSYKLYPLSENSIQGDSVIVQWFNDIGLKIEFYDNEVFIHCKHLQTPVSKTFDMKRNLDLFPVMAALACKLPAKFTFLNINNLQHKESNRLEAVKEQFSCFANIISDNNNSSITIEGKNNNQFDNVFFDSHNDHRLAMAYLLLTNENNISNTECLKKSYPKLLTQLRHSKF